MIHNDYDEVEHIFKEHKLKFELKSLDYIEENYYLMYDLFDYFISEMPYGTAKARTGDPYNWIYNRVESLLS